METGALSSTEKKRERELLKAHAIEWTRPLDVALRPDRLRFVRGFLDTCTVRFKTKTQRAELVGHPMWATVREIATKKWACSRTRACARCAGRP